MKSSIRLTLLFLSLVGISACNAGTMKPTSQNSSDSSIDYYDLNFTTTEIPANDYTYHQWTSVPPYRLLSTLGVYDYIAEYKSLKPFTLVSEQTPDSDGYYHTYLSLSFVDGEEKTFPQKGTYSYSQSEEYDLILVNTIGKYVYYSRYFYSETVHAIKYEKAVYKPVDVANPEAMVGKTFLRVALTNSGELPILGNHFSPTNIRTIEPFEETTYYKVRDDVKVSFDRPE